MKLFLTASAAIALAFSAQAHAAGQEGEPGDETAEKANDPDKMVCRRFAITGTRVKQKVCRTQGQWEALQRQAEENARSITDAGAINTTPREGGN